MPPATKRPVSRSSPRSPSLSAPQTVVVTPEECQSKPSRQPKAWNQKGWESRSSMTCGPNSSTTASVTWRARRTMRWKSHGGAWPPWSGRWEMPVRAMAASGPGHRDAAQV